MKDRDIAELAGRAGLTALVGSDGSVAYRSGKDCEHVYLDELRAVIDAGPLVWTIHGNVPESSLRYEKHWTDDGKVLWLHEEWFFEDGTLAKNNAHGYGYGLKAEVFPATTSDVTIGLHGIGTGVEQARM